VHHTAYLKELVCFLWDSCFIDVPHALLSPAKTASHAAYANCRRDVHCAPSSGCCMRIPILREPPLVCANSGSLSPFSTTVSQPSALSLSLTPRTPSLSLRREKFAILTQLSSWFRYFDNPNVGFVIVGHQTRAPYYFDTIRTFNTSCTCICAV
jgi:hypothetical protein